MNIFKILANGDGTINEANVSAFLGYLLDPYADHGLGFLFIEKFIYQINPEIKVNKFDYEILFEQAFNENGKSKQIVDIVILCFDNNQGTGTESIATNLLSKNRKLASIFLVENKIRKAAKTKDQLTNQFEATIDVLKKLKLGEDIVYSAYITPNIEGFEDEFSSLNSTGNAIHLAWKENTINEEHSILSILKNIIHNESIGEIEAINEYTKHTIKSFIKFVENDFKSKLQEEKERKNDGTYTLGFIVRNEEYQIEEKMEILRKELITLNPLLNDLNPRLDMTDKRFPCISITAKGIIIKIGAKMKNNKITVSMGYGLDKEYRKESRNYLLIYGKNLDCEIKNANSYNPYFTTAEINKEIDIADVESINTALILAIEQLKS